MVSVQRATDLPRLESILVPLGIRILCGDGSSIQLANTKADIIVASIVGIAGLLPTIQAVKHGTKVALANKESIVCAGTILMSLIKEYGTTLLPVDSEHNAIFQVLNSKHMKNLDTVYLTCSGGPFHNLEKQKFNSITLKEALNHPNWSMGSKITIDSATLMNKALEWIEAIWLFNLKPHQLEVVIHPQSIIHSYVAYDDGTNLAQMGSPDMITPISYALSYPNRLATTAKKLNLIELGSLTFAAVDEDKFPSIELAKRAYMQGQAMTIALNASNEIAVHSFLNDEITFLEIYDVITYTMKNSTNITINTIDDVLKQDNHCRNIARQHTLELQDQRT